MFFKKKSPINPNDKYTPWLNFYRGPIKSHFFTPFIMQTHVPNLTSDLVNTDKYGLRHTIGANGACQSFEHLEDNGSCNFLLGGSVSFGWGATAGDRATIPSLLSRKTGETWLNLGVCGQVLQGNLVQLMFLGQLPHKVDRVVFLGGFNELAAFVNGSIFSSTFGGMFEQSKFHSAMNNLSLEQYSEERLLSGDFMMLPSRSMECVEAFKASITHAIKILNFQANALGAKLHYVLQPFPSWMERRLITQEAELWDWNVEQHLPYIKEQFYEEIAKAGQWYATFLQDICGKRGINFVNLNTELSAKKYENTWMFIDPGHLTNEANDIIAGIIADTVI